MIRPYHLCSLALLALVACLPPSGGPEALDNRAPVSRAAAATGPLSAELIRRREPGPPPSTDGACWARDITPAIIETVTEHQLIQPAEVDADGHIREQASFRTVTEQRIVQDREEIWFRTPCPAEMNLTFIATLQRALKARGLYRPALTGVMDAATRDAIRRYQEPRGLDSDLLSLAAARDLGIMASPLSEIQSRD
jgi:hypothetical protein